jgi:hypothetical protein
MATLYTIRNWDKLYENAESRKLKTLKFVPVQNKHDGKSYRRLLNLRENLPELQDGLRMFAAWILILQIASKCAKRGVLADEDGPLTAEDMALKTGASEEVFQCTLNVLSGNDFRWIEATEIPEPRENIPELLEEPGKFQARREGNRRELIPSPAREEAPEESQPVTIPPDLEDSAMRIFGSVPLNNLTEWCRLYPADWVRKAMSVTERRSKRSASYTNGILQDWQRQGEPDDGEGNKQGGKSRRGGKQDKGYLGESRNQLAGL